MEPRISVITLGVSDLAASRDFYVRGLGWPASSISDENIVFIDLSGLVLGLFPKDRLAEDAGLDLGSGFGGIALAQNVGSPKEVDQVLSQATAAGATLLKPAAKTFWGGYSGYFADPDGYPWEIAHNPFWPLDAEGRAQLPL